MKLTLFLTLFCSTASNFGVIRNIFTTGRAKVGLDVDITCWYVIVYIFKGGNEFVILLESLSPTLGYFHFFSHDLSKKDRDPSQSARGGFGFFLFNM